MRSIVRSIRGRPGIAALAAGLALSTAGCVIDIGGIDLNEDVRPDAQKVEATADLARLVPVQGRSGLALVGGNGNVLVRGEEGIGEVTIRAVRRVRSHSREDALEHLPLLRVLVTPRTGDVEVRTRQPDETYGRGYQVDYDITVPASWWAWVVNGNGTVIVRDLRGEVHVEDGSGDVALTRHGGDVRVALGNGEIHADVALPARGTLVLTSGNGGIGLTLRPGASAAFGARVGNGTLDIAGLSFAQWVATPRTATGVLGTGDGLVDLSVGNGWIRVRGG